LEWKFKNELEKRFPLIYKNTGGSIWIKKYRQKPPASAPTANVAETTAFKGLFTLRRLRLLPTPHCGTFCRPWSLLRKALGNQRVQFSFRIFNRDIPRQGGFAGGEAHQV
jgi:hypothetical protein